MAQITATPFSEFTEVSCGEEKEILTMVNLKAPTTDVEASRNPIDLICVIDKSGSMAGDKMRMMKETLQFVIEQLTSADNMSLIMYDTNVVEQFAFSKMTPEGKAKARREVSALRDGSSTNLSGGLLKGLDVAATRPVAGRNVVCSVLLFTDGLANAGISSTPEIISATQNRMANIHDPVSVFTFGFGSDHDPNLLKGIAESGKGMFYYIRTADEIPTAFADCLGGLQSVVAQNVNVTFEAVNGNVSFVKFLNTKYQTSATFPCQSFSVGLGDLYSEEERDVIALIKLQKLPAPQPNAPIVTFNIKYFNVTTLSDHSMSCQSSIARPTTASTQTRDEHIDKQFNRIRTAETLEESNKLAAAGRLQEARAMVQQTRDLIAQSVSANDDYVSKLSSELLDVEQDMMTESRYRAQGSKKMAARAMAHGNQRGNADMDFGFYETSAKMASKAKSSKYSS